MPLASYSTLKRSSKLGRAHIGVEHSISLMDSKSLWAVFIHSKLPFFVHSITGGIMIAKLLDKPTIEGDRSMKVINFCDGSWDGPALVFFNFGFINLDPPSKDNTTKENNLRSKELTILNFSI